MRIAVVRRNGLGDLLCTYPLLAHIKKKFPNCMLTLFVEKRSYPLAQYLKEVDRIVCLPAGGNKYWHYARLGWALRGEFDVAISAKTSPMKLMNGFLWALKAPQRIAYVDTSWHARLINCPLPYMPQCAAGQHQALKALRLIDPLCTHIPKEYYPHICLPSPPTRSSIPCILLAATTTHVGNQLPPEAFGAILNVLYTETPFTVLVVAQKHDAARAAAMCAGLQMEHALHFPPTFENLLHLLAQADVYCVADGGIAHLGAALGKRGVVLFGASDPVQWAPLSDTLHPLYHFQGVEHIEISAIQQNLRYSLSSFKLTVSNTV